MQLTDGTLLQGGKYKIESVLGQGGFGITYLASQVQLGRKVCIKEFFFKQFCERDAATSHVTLGTKSNRELVDKFMQKFVKEARTISQLDHQNIIRIHDIFEENNTAYYVMEYHSSGSLGNLLKDKRALSEADAVRYITQIADAVGYIHERNINHLDIKPDNIIIGSRGCGVLIDFGLSKQYDEKGSQTSSTPVGISHGYAPMEQYNPGGVSTFTPQSDIYSLGATLYKLVTGATPPQANEIFNDGLPELPAHLSDGVKKAIEQSMQPRKNDRPATVKEFLALLSLAVPSEKNRDPEIMVVIEPEEEPKKRTTKKKETNNPDSTLVIGTKKTVKKEEPKKVAKFPVPSDATFNDGLAAVESNGKRGYIDKNGNVIVPFKYEVALHFSEKLAAIKLRGKWGFIDKQDNLVIPLKYEDAWSFYEGLAAVKLKGKWGFINKDGNVVIPLKYDDVEPFSEGLAAVEVNGKWGVIDKSDNLVIPFKYDYVGDFSNGRAEFELNGRKGYIDKYGTEHYNNGGYIPSTPSAKVENKKTVETNYIEEEWSIRKSSFCKWGAFILIIIIFIFIAIVNGDLELDPSTIAACFAVLIIAWNIFFD